MSRRHRFPRLPPPPPPPYPPLAPKPFHTQHPTSEGCVCYNPLATLTSSSRTHSLHQPIGSAGHAPSAFGQMCDAITHQSAIKRSVCSQIPCDPPAHPHLPTMWQPLVFHCVHSFTFSVFGACHHTGHTRRLLSQQPAPAPPPPYLWGAGNCNPALCRARQTLRC